MLFIKFKLKTEQRQERKTKQIGRAKVNEDGTNATPHIHISNPNHTTTSLTLITRNLITCANPNRMTVKRLRHKVQEAIGAQIGDTKQ